MPPDFYPENNVVQSRDGELRTLHKIADCTCLGGGASNATVEVHDGDPDTPGSTFSAVWLNIHAGCNSIWVWNPAVGPWWIQMNGEDFSGNYSCPTIVEVRALPTVDCAPIRARTFGNLVAGDAQATEYWFDPDSTDTDDGMSTLLPDDRTVADTGRWKQLHYA
jgi:hypothetical protein